MNDLTPPQSCVELESLELTRFRNARRRAWGSGTAGLSLFGALGFGYACASVQRPSLALVAATVACSSLFIPAIIAAIVASIKAGRFNKRFAQAIDSID